MTVTIIAEAGLNHGGDLATALRMIDVARDCGADACKFQIAPPTITHDPDGQATLERCWLTYDEHRQLFDHCAEVRIEYMATPFDVDAVRFLASLPVQRIKIGSGDITNMPLLAAAGETGLPVILSTGASDEQELHAAIGRVLCTIPGADEVNWLWCRSEYPTAPASQGLPRGGLDALGFDGLSDHSPPGEIVPAVMAVAMGARIVERHFRLSYRRCRECEEFESASMGSTVGRCARSGWSGFIGNQTSNYRACDQDHAIDHAVSDNPEQLRAYVEAIRKAESALGDGTKQPTPGELAIRHLIRRGPDGKRPAGEKR